MLMIYLQKILLSEMASRIIEVRPTSAILISLISQENYCDVCQKHLKNHGAKQFHMRKSHNRHIESMDSAMGLTNIKGGDGDPTTETRFFCPIEYCRSNQNKCFKSSKLLVQHFQKTHYAKQFKCENCPAKFALERDLRYHNNKVLFLLFKLIFSIRIVRIAKNWTL